MNHGSQSICLDALLLKEKPPAHHELAADKHKLPLKLGKILKQKTSIVCILHVDSAKSDIILW